MRYYRNVFDLGDLNTALQEAFEIKQDRYKYESLGKHKTCLLIFFNNSLRTRLSTQKAARNLGMDVIVLDVNQGAWKLETERGVIMEKRRMEKQRRNRVYKTSRFTQTAGKTGGFLWTKIQKSKKKRKR